MTGSFLASALFGSAMPLELTRSDMAIRLLCALIAGGIIGFNRGEHGKAAGLRTTMLVCLAAAVAMLQMNYLLTLSGRESGSFVMNDLMRLPLGILTGVGFIGGGAILRRGSLIIGVTTAATLWYVTVVGLCFGGGQVLLGWVATGLGLIVVWGFDRVEEWMPIERQARLAITVDPTGPEESVIRNRLAAAAIEVREFGLAVENEFRIFSLTVREFRRPSDSHLPPAIAELSRAPGVRRLKWHYFE